MCAETEWLCDEYRAPYISARDLYKEAWVVKSFHNLPSLLSSTRRKNFTNSTSIPRRCYSSSSGAALLLKKTHESHPSTNANMSELSPRSEPAAGAPIGGRLRSRSEMTIASRAGRAIHRISVSEFRLEDGRDNPAITWGTPIINSRRSRALIYRPGRGLAVRK